MLPKISVAMAVFNGREFLFEQLNSIVNQSVSVNEIVIVDDCSSSKSEDIIREATKDFKGCVKYFMNEANRGYAQTFFKALHESEGDIIFLADQDDIWELNKVELYIQVFIENENVLCLSSLNTLIDSNGSIIKKEKRNGSVLKKIKPENVIKQIRNSLRPGMTLGFRRTVKDLVFQIDLSQIESHDRLLEYVAAINFGYFLLGEYCTRYRIHSSNTSGMNLSHFKLRSDIYGRISQIDKELRYLKSVINLYNPNKKIICGQISYYEKRKQLLMRKSIILYLLLLLPLLFKYGKFKILVADIMSIMQCR